MPRKTRESMRIAQDTLTGFDIDDEPFLAVTQGVQESTGTKKAGAASREAAGRLNEVYETHQERSKRSQQLDEAFEATLTTDVDTWKSDPTDYDFPGVDTPKGFNYDL